MNDLAEILKTDLHPVIHRYNAYKNHLICYSICNSAHLKEWYALLKTANIPPVSSSLTCYSAKVTVDEDNYFMAFHKLPVT